MFWMNPVADCAYSFQLIYNHSKPIISNPSNYIEASTDHIGE